MMPRSRTGAVASPSPEKVVVEEVSVPHIAVGIWIATVAVLVIPSVGRQKHRVTEDHLLRAYSTVMAAFPLL